MRAHVPLIARRHNVCDLSSHPRGFDMISLIFQLAVLYHGASARSQSMLLHVVWVIVFDSLCVDRLQVMYFDILNMKDAVSSNLKSNFRFALASTSVTC